MADARAGTPPPQTDPRIGDPLAPLLAARGVVVLDGGLATQL
jgi:hypothetical protein